MCPLGPKVPLSRRGVFAVTHLASIYLLAYTLSKALVTTVSYSKNWSVNIWLVPSWTLSNLAIMLSLKSLFMYTAADAAVDDFGFLKCFSLNKNYLFKLLTSIISGSVRIICPPGNFFLG